MMMKKDYGKQQKMIITSVEELMPQEHFLRDLEQLVDFSFIYQKVEDLYSKKGRNSIDPVIIIKMLLIGYLYGINSERKIEQEIKVNIAYRWFIGIDFDERVPDHSTISQLRRRKFRDSNIFQEIFDEIVIKCIETGLVTGKLLLTDSTHIKANATNNLRETITVEEKPSKYIQKLDEMAISEGLIKETSTKQITKTKEVVKSVTDPDCGVLNRPGKPKGFHYLSHQTCDGESGIVTDVYVTPANVSDNVPHSERITLQIEKFDLKTQEIGADAGYYSSEIHKEMLDRNIKTYIPINKKEIENDDNFSSLDFEYNEEKDCFLCPNNKCLTRKNYRRGKGTVKFSTSIEDCRNCEFKEKCIGNQPKKVIEKAFNFKYTIKQNKNVATERYFQVMRLRKIFSEGNFSHQKANHNLNNLKKRGNANVKEHCLLSACAFNLKRMVKLSFA